MNVGNNYHHVKQRKNFDMENYFIIVKDGIKVFEKDIIDEIKENIEVDSVNNFINNNVCISEVLNLENCKTDKANIYEGKTDY